MHHDPSEASAARRAGTGPRNVFAWIIAVELVFGGLLATIMWLSRGPTHNSEFPNQQRDVHAHFNYRNNPPLPAIVNGSVAPGQNPQNGR